MLLCLMYKIYPFPKKNETTRPEAWLVTQSVSHPFAVVGSLPSEMLTCQLPGCLAITAEAKALTKTHIHSLPSTLVCMCCWIQKVKIWPHSLTSHSPAPPLFLYSGT